MMYIYITFGFDHRHTVLGKTFNFNTVAKIPCDDYDQGRRLAFAFFGDKWAFAYANTDMVRNEIIKSVFNDE